MILKEYKRKNKTICYISSISIGNRDLFFVRTGSPKDAQCLSWKYDNLEAAEKTAAEYYDNMNAFFYGVAN